MTCLCAYTLANNRRRVNSPVIDRRYWDLLSTVLRALSLSSSSAVPTKAWLLPLLNRVPLVPIYTSLLERLNEVDAESAVGLLDVSALSTVAMWPLASPKFTADALLDCFGALLSMATRIPTASVGLSKLGSLVSTSLQDAFNHSSNKKKVRECPRLLCGLAEPPTQIHQTFTQTHLQRWVACVACLKGDGSLPALLNDMYHTGRDILFNPDTLKSMSEPSSLKAMLASMSVTEASLQALPKLLQSYAEATRKHRILFGQGPSAPAAARVVAMLFFSICADYARSAPSALFGASCEARLAMLRVVEDESFLGFGQVDGQQAIRREVALCISAIPSDSIRESVIDTLTLGTDLSHSNHRLSSLAGISMRHLAHRPRPA